MDREVYEQMHRVEMRHWWFRARRHVLAARIKELHLPPGARILEVGCGTGGNLPMLADHGIVSAFDMWEPAIEYAKQKQVADVRVGRIPDSIPFEKESFDLVFAADVIEHLKDDTETLQCLMSYIKPDGWLLVTVPAYPFLWSHHDVTHQHYRRYTQETLLELFAQAKLYPQMSYCNTLLFPLIAGIRLLQKLLKLKSDDDRIPSHWLNETLYHIFAAEKFLVGKIPMPFGVSIMAWVRKQ
ncbi:MAG: class I SAM-dependent methyltransferase [Rickettsiales bacterium]